MIKYLCSKENYFSVFLFHGVIKKKKTNIRNYNNKHLIDSKFFKIIKNLKSNGIPMSLDEVIYYIKNKKKIPKKTFVVTFDDGFENNYSIAAPILNDLKIPATFYFSTDFVENNTMSWIDKIEYCFEKDKKQKKFQINQLGNHDISSIKKKIKTLNFIRKKIKSDFNINIDEITSKVFNYFKIKEINKSNDDLDKKINWSKVKLLNSNELFTIGGHSHVHMPLTYFRYDEAKKQILKSMKLFKDRAKIDLIHYSYPEGQKRDYNNDLKLFLKKKGIISCPTAINGFNKYSSDLFELKRIQI